VSIAKSFWPRRDARLFVLLAMMSRAACCFWRHTRRITASRVGGAGKGGRRRPRESSSSSAVHITTARDDLRPSYTCKYSPPPPLYALCLISQRHNGPPYLNTSFLSFITFRFVHLHLLIASTGLSFGYINISCDIKLFNTV